MGVSPKLNAKFLGKVLAKGARTLLCSSVALTLGCTLVGGQGKSVALPYLHNTPNSCYYLDEFFPKPDSLVTGKSAGYFVRYYTYVSADYKEWEREKLMLTFYSRDGYCWILYGEYPTGLPPFKEP